MKTMKWKRDSLCKLAELSLRLANIIDRKGEQGEMEIADEMGYGYLALSGCLRDGVKAIADIQSDYSKAKSEKELAEISERDARDFLEDIFGDREVDSLNGKAKEEIKDFVEHLFGD